MSSPSDKRVKMSDRKGKSAGVSKPKTGFRVGRALPDGPQLRRVQQIKRGLIENAKLRKQYAKLKGKGPSGANDIPLGDPGVSPPLDNVEPPPMQPLEDVSEVEWSDEDDGDERKVKRRAAAHEVEEDDTPETRDETRAGRVRRQKPQPFQKQEREADRRRREIEERIEARAKADRERQQKTEERERFRKAMAKARTGGKNGQRKLGRESAVLLEKVQRMVGN
jgi:hypothetical protein